MCPLPIVCKVEIQFFCESGQAEGGRCLPLFASGLVPTSSATYSPITRLFMEFATETQTGPSRWTTDDVDVISPTMPELQHSQRTWPIPMTLFAVAITLVIIGMKWREARRKRKLKEGRKGRSVPPSHPTVPKHLRPRS